MTRRKASEHTGSSTRNTVTSQQVVTPTLRAQSYYAKSAFLPKIQSPDKSIGETKSYSDGEYWYLEYCASKLQGGGRGDYVIGRLRGTKRNPVSPGLSSYKYGTAAAYHGYDKPIRPTGSSR